MNLFWFLFGAGLVLGCEWDSSEDQDLDLTYSPQLGDPLNVTDAEGCKAACCGKEGCDAAMVGAPQDGALTCYLVTCRVLGSDQCRLAHKLGVQVHRKRQEAGSESLLQPLLGESQPEKKERTEENGESKEVPFDLPLIASKCVTVRHKRKPPHHPASFQKN